MCTSYASMKYYNYFCVYTDTGKILKVVFSVSGSQPSTFDPIVAEEITVITCSNDKLITVVTCPPCLALIYPILLDIYFSTINPQEL